MKSFLVTALIMAHFFSFGQSTDSIPKISGEYGYEEVVKLDTSFTKEKLYRNAKVFFVDAFKSAKDVIQYDDKGEGKIIGKGLFEVKGFQKQNLMYGWDILWKVYFSTEIICKDGRYKYRIYDIKINETAIFNGDYAERNKEMLIDDVLRERKEKVKKSYEPMYKDAVIRFKSTISNLKDYMGKNASINKDDF